MAASPPITPGQGGLIYFVLCDYGPKIGKAYRETDPDAGDQETVLNLLIRGEYSQVLELDLEAGRARDASAEFAAEVLERARVDDLPADVGYSLP